jgi:hypothetical protein
MRNPQLFLIYDILGLTSFLILRMWFGKAVQDFNTSIAVQGGQAPQLVAQTSNAFTSRSPAVSLFLPFTGLSSGVGCVRILRSSYYHLACEAECKAYERLMSYDKMWSWPLENGSTLQRY